ncbi:DUF1631 family protein [Aquabacterium sp.]|uniref:DUF1631 family protein n=1 Tax=Aquabacterium sp. TaxID=1872578 RepID=UPI0035B01B60
MVHAASSHPLAQQARRAYLDALLRECPSTLQAILDGGRALAAQTPDPALHSKRRDAVAELTRKLTMWDEALRKALRDADPTRASLGNSPRPAQKSSALDLALVDDATIENGILGSRLAQTIGDRTSWQFSDLRARLSSLEKFEDLPPNDILAPQSLSDAALKAWLAIGLDAESWRTLQNNIHDEFALLVEAAYHDANRWLLDRGVCPDIDLRPFIRLSRSSRELPSAGPAGPASAVAGARAATGNATSAGPARSPAAQQADVVLSQLSQFMSKHLSDYGGLPPTGPARPPSSTLRQAIGQAQASMQSRFGGANALASGPAVPSVTEELQRQKVALKQAASTPVERATIEVVALMFQSILTDERIPASVRVWFARLQMPVLRVAVGEPDFFANIDHPARQLIDRMGSCVMGFDAAAAAIGDTLEKEIKRVVQVVEAYPDTGRRVFQTVLTEFERFLQHYFQTENEATKKGVSLAQQVEQRETLAIQYTIELRKMLNEVPVQEGVRDFLFHTWADVLATTAIKSGTTSEATKNMKRAAADLIWSASAKVSREERAEVIRRLPPLLKTLRDGMAQAGMPSAKQEEHIQTLNSSLAAAFTAKAAPISNARLSQLMDRLETLDELLPESSDVQLDPATIMDLSGHETADLEVVGEGGAAPTPAMLAWAQQLQVGSWYQLDYRNRVEPVQLAWQGLRKHLSLFVTPHGRGVLFQQHRLASFLQAGLLVPAEDESLTARATRKALAKLDADPQRMLN